jgi:crotonobetainyl-CoA:carnitine CoA-transferase CaiB-like acyl-CoA transferase
MNLKASTRRNGLRSRGGGDGLWTMLASPWRASRTLTVPVQHDYLGETDIFTIPSSFPAGHPQAARRAPLLGEHTGYVLGTVLGLEPSAIAQLEDSRVLR